MTEWLIDRSARVRARRVHHVEQGANRIERGLVRIASVTGSRSATAPGSATQARAVFATPLAAMPVEYLTPAIEDRAVEVQLVLADRGQPRAPSIPDLIAAAIDELAGLTALHVDKDFELIANAR